MNVTRDVGDIDVSNGLGRRSFRVDMEEAVTHQRAQ